MLSVLCTCLIFDLLEENSHLLDCTLVYLEIPKVPSLGVFPVESFLLKEVLHWYTVNPEQDLESISVLPQVSDNVTNLETTLIAPRLEGMKFLLVSNYFH